MGEDLMIFVGIVIISWFAVSIFTSSMDDREKTIKRNLKSIAAMNSIQQDLISRTEVAELSENSPKSKIQ